MVLPRTTKNHYIIYVVLSHTCHGLQYLLHHRLKDSRGVFSPNGMRVYWNLPNGQLKVVFSLLSSDIRIWWNPDVRSNFDRTELVPTQSKISLREGNQNLLSGVILLTSLKSMHTRIEPSFLRTGTTGLNQTEFEGLICQPPAFYLAPF